MWNLIKSVRFFLVLTGKIIQNTKRYNDKTMIRVTRHYLNTRNFFSQQEILLGRTQQDTRTDKDTRVAYRISELRYPLGLGLAKSQLTLRSLKIIDRWDKPIFRFRMISSCVNSVQLSICIVPRHYTQLYYSQLTIDLHGDNMSNTVTDYAKRVWRLVFVYLLASGFNKLICLMSDSGPLPWKYEFHFRRLIIDGMPHVFQSRFFNLLKRKIFFVFLS